MRPLMSQDRDLLDPEFQNLNGEKQTNKRKDTSCFLSSATIHLWSEQGGKHSPSRIWLEWFFFLLGTPKCWSWHCRENQTNKLTKTSQKTTNQLINFKTNLKKPLIKYWPGRWMLAKSTPGSQEIGQYSCCSEARKGQTTWQLYQGKHTSWRISCLLCPAYIPCSQIKRTCLRKWKTKNSFQHLTYALTIYEINFVFFQEIIRQTWSHKVTIFLSPPILN